MNAALKEQSKILFLEIFFPLLHSNFSKSSLKNSPHFPLVVANKLCKTSVGIQPTACIPGCCSTTEPPRAFHNATGLSRIFNTSASRVFRDTSSVIRPLQKIHFLYFKHTSAGSPPTPDPDFVRSLSPPPSTFQNQPISSEFFQEWLILGSQLAEPAFFILVFPSLSD